MGGEHSAAATLSFPVVQPEEGEALSSWLARIARTLLLDLDHVADEIGCKVQMVDHGPDEATIAQVALRTGASHQAIGKMVLPLSPQLARPTHGSLDWRVCSTCLAADTRQGRAPHVRLAWLNLLSTVCIEHRSSLTIPTADEWEVLTPDEANSPRQDHGLRDLSAEPIDSLVYAARLFQLAQPSGADIDAVSGEVLDLVDALGVQVSQAMGRGAALTLFEHPRRRRHVTPLSLDLQRGLVAGLDPADRLLFVRAALALRWPSAGYAQEHDVLGDWFTRVVLAAVPSGRRRIIGDDPRDPLGLLAVALPARPFHQLRQRAATWSEDLRLRWLAAEQLAALAGLS